MATKQRSRPRRSSGPRERAPRFVAPVLDPTWHSPYAPSSAERHENQHVVRQFALRRKAPITILAFVAVVALVVGVVVVPWLPIVAIALAALYAWDLRRSLVRFERQGTTLGAAVLAEFPSRPGGPARDSQRLATVIDRLAATFGVDGVSGYFVEDECYNAALVPHGHQYALVVTSALVRDFELIELEGVVAHCLARQRLGILTRQSVACVANLSDENRRALAGEGLAYRADEVAAAAIRYPLGLAGALRKCARQSVPSDSFFTSDTYANWRYIFFDVASDRREADLGDLDDVELRARALEEW